jgi:hypothetical protein
MELRHLSQRSQMATYDLRSRLQYHHMRFTSDMGCSRKLEMGMLHYSGLRSWPQRVVLRLGTRDLRGR